MAAALAAAAAAAQTRAPFDILVRHGTVIDGSGLPRFAADVAIVDGVIARVGDLSAERGQLEIDASRLFVAPGFLNIHSHAVPGALARAENMLTQGVTTEILNPDGGGALDLAQQLDRAAASGLAVNVGAYIGFNSVWSQVIGEADRSATPEDIARMRALVAGGLERGAWGVSAGLDYKPAYFAQIEEVVRALEPAARWRTNFPNHERLTPETHYSSRAGISETIAIGERSGIVPVITHMKAQGREQDTAPALLAMLDAATKRGHYAAADAYPYVAGQTSLGALLIPAWAQDGGRDRMLERFRDPELRRRIVSETEEAMNARFGGADGVYLPTTQQELTDVMRAMGVSAGEAVVRLLEQSNMRAILRFGIESDVVKILQHPATSIACDCGASTDTRQHPRYLGTFPRVLGHYVRETGALTWEDAVRKMTALPAATIGMVDRGWIAPGMAADVTIFDPATVIDHATYANPERASEGIRYVIVNGRVEVRDGAITGEQGGRILARTIHMPSRPMTAGARHVNVRGAVGSADVAIALEQSAAARQATGTMRVTSGGDTIEAVSLGVLQTADRWASFTARVRVAPAGAERSALVIVEDADPTLDGRPRTVSIQVDGGPAIAGPVR